MEDRGQINLQCRFPLVRSVRMKRFTATQNTGHVNQSVEVSKGFCKVVSQFMGTG